jgi:hypoxanthine phosphoribosyltransferase
MSADEPPRDRRSYDYTTRTGVREVSWEEFAAMSAQLAETLAAKKIDTIVGIARAGLFPATAVASALRCELYPVRLTRRLHDEVVYDSPVWRVPVSPLIEGKAVAIVDEIADTGETLALVAAQARDLRAERVVTACLVTHSWAQPPPDVCALVTDDFVLFPWDQRVLIDGQWQRHPEVVAALEAQPSNEPREQ